jgi:hypothetical protein
VSCPYHRVHLADVITLLRFRFVQETVNRLNVDSSDWRTQFIAVPVTYGPETRSVT